MHNENVLMWLPLPQFLQDYKNTVFRKLDMYEQNVITICRTMDGLIQKEPEIFNTITVIVLAVFVVRIVLGLVGWFRSVKRVKIGSEMANLRKQLEKARADLVTVRKHLTEKGDNLAKAPAQKPVKNVQTADLDQKIQKLNNDNKQLLSVINRYASCVQSSHKFNHFFLNQFTHIISQLTKVRSQLARPNSKSLNRTQTNKSIISDLAKEDPSFQQMKSLYVSSAASVKPDLTRHESHQTNGHSNKLLNSDVISYTPMETPQQSPIETPKKVEEPVTLNSDEKNRMRMLDEVDESEAKSVGNRRIPPPPGVKGPVKISKAPMPRVTQPVITNVEEVNVDDKANMVKEEKVEPPKEEIKLQEVKVEVPAQPIEKQDIEPTIIKPVEQKIPQVIYVPRPQQVNEVPAPPPVAPPIIKRSTLPPPPSQLPFNRPGSINRPGAPKRPEQKMPLINPVPVPVVEEPKQEPVQNKQQKQLPIQQEIKVEPVKQPEITNKQAEPKEEKPVEMPLQRPKTIPPPPNPNRKVPPPPVRRG